MANKLLTLAGLKAAVGKSESKNIVDGPLGEALKLYEYHDDEEKINERRDALDKVIKATNDIFKAKKTAPTDKDVVKYLNDVLKAATTERKKVDADLAKFGMKKVSVHVLLWDWKEVPMHNRNVWVQFKSPGRPHIALNKEIKGGSLEFTDVSLPPKGSVYINAFPSHGSDDQAQGQSAYDISGLKTTEIQITAKQSNSKKKTKAKNAQEAAHKVGAKGKAGFDFIVKGEVEGAYEYNKKNTSDKEEEVEVLVPEKGLKIEKVS